jgi:NADH-quinone oxidoreductase subunit F
MTVTMEDAVYGWGGGVLDDLKLKAVIPGGASMPVLRFDAPYRGWDGEERRDDLKLPLDFESLRAAGSMLGSAALIVMHQRTCMVQALYNLLRFYHHESCGQCTPCREGTGWLEKILQRMVQGEGRPEDVERLLSIARRMSGTTICLLSDSCAMPVGSFVLKFREEFEHYCRHGRSMTPEAIRL